LPVQILDFFDTIFMVVRGKFEQFSFLHVYHHFTIFLTYWLVTSVGYDGDVYYTIVANSFVHLVMYYYYLISSMGAKPWWGKYVTMLQMGQFVTMNAQAGYILYNNCAYPANVTWFYLVYIMSLFALFANFFVQRWLTTPAKAKVAGKKA
jgi:elongation of very long chain fatty acids protein 4